MNAIADPPFLPYPDHLNSHAILDSGTTGTFLTPKDTIHLQNPTTAIDGPTVLSASGTAMPSTIKGMLGLSEHLTSSAQSALNTPNVPPFKIRTSQPPPQGHVRVRGTRQLYFSANYIIVPSY